MGRAETNKIYITNRLRRDTVLSYIEPRVLHFMFPVDVPLC